MTGPSSAREQTLERVKWSINVRYIVLASTLALSLTGTFVAQLLTPLLAGLFLAGLVLFYNLSAHIYINHKNKSLSGSAIRHAGLFLTLADVFMITLLIFFTGGLLSPFVLLYLYTLLIMSIIAPEWPWYSRFVGLVVFILYESLLLLEFLGLVPLISITRQGEAIYTDLGLLMYHMIFFPIALIAMAFLAGYINIFLTRSNKVLFKRIDFLTETRQKLEKTLAKQKAAEQRLGALTKEWAETFDAMGDAVSIHGSNFAIINANATLAKMVGKTVNELIGQHCYSILHQKDCPIQNCPLEKARLTKKQESIEYYEPTLKAWLSVITSPILDVNGQVVKVIHVARDITERKKAEQRLEDSVKELKEFHNLAVGRELKMIELEKQLARLKNKD